MIVSIGDETVIGTSLSLVKNISNHELSLFQTKACRSLKVIVSLIKVFLHNFDLCYFIEG